MKYLWLAFVVACQPVTPSDDPDDYDVDTSRTYNATISEPVYLAPSRYLPKQVRDQASNNNVGLTFHDGRMFLAFRTAPIHFASPDTVMYVISSADVGKSWRYEHEIALGSDVREPSLTSFKGTLWFYFFQAGTNPLAFEPKGVFRKKYLGPGKFSEMEQFGGAEEVPWEIKVRRGAMWLTSYQGNHYQGGAANIEVSFRRSDDGVTFAPAEADHGVVYTGGVSEVAWELDQQGNLWAVTRNEDGDDSGFGSHVCYANKDALGHWDCKASPYRYDSPRMFRHGKDIYLVARRDPNGPYDQSDKSLSISEQRTRNLLTYSSNTKRSAIYKLNTEEKTIELVMDIPGVGDTAFPSVHRLDAHRFIIANYTSPLENGNDPVWSAGQTSKDGTYIYLTTLTLAP